MRRFLNKIDVGHVWRTLPLTAYSVLLGVAVVGSLGLLINGESGALRRAVTDIQFKLSPSAEDAFAIANVHFDAIRVKDYDLARAESYFRETLALNPAFPMANHQLGRLAFLKGMHSTALALMEREIELSGASTSPSTHYMRGLILGFQENFTEAALSFEKYLEADPYNWAAINDYAWVLLKDGRQEDAMRATARGLQYFPHNPWLLTMHSTALYERGDIEGARIHAREALISVQKITEEQWLIAYPGNDPLIAREGIASFQEAVRVNMHTILHGAVAGKKDVR